MFRELLDISKLLTDFLGLITLVVGGTAIYLYKKQKIDRKRDAASLILQEIRYAEEQIRNYRNYHEYKLFDRLLPTNSWNDNIHLFVKDLKEGDIDLINSFYARAGYIDVVIRKISDWKNMPSLPMRMPSASIASQIQGEPTVPTGNVQSGIVPFVNFDPMGETQKILEETSMRVEFIFNTPVVEKLRRISERKWHQIF